MRASVFAALLLVASAARADDDGDHQHDTRAAADGSSYRVGFDPATRVFVGGGYAPGVASGAEPEAARGYIETGVGYRHRWDFDDGVSWKLSHRVLDGRVVLGAGLDFEARAYRGEYIRWSRDGQLLFPPDTRLPFPLDIGFTADLGRLRYRELDPGLGVELGVLRSEIVLGLLRSQAHRTALQLAFGPRYQLRLEQPAPGAPVEVSHLVVPFSGGTASFRHESEDGLHALVVEASPAYAYRVDHDWTFSFAARAAYELVFVAVNDLPISAYLEASYVHDGAPVLGRAEHELTTLAGLRFSVPLAP